LIVWIQRVFGTNLPVFRPETLLTQKTTVLRKIFLSGSVSMMKKKAINRMTMVVSLLAGVIVTMNGYLSQVPQCKDLEQ
jgi:hypothetical protein